MSRRAKFFTPVAGMGKVWGSGLSQNVVWYVVRTCCEKASLEHIAPHDLRRTCAKLCHSRGGELEQIQFLLGHVSVQTTERYLGCKQNLGRPVNDLFNLRLEEQTPGKDRESVAPNGPSEAVEKAIEQGIECRHGGSNHDGRVYEPKQLSLPERTGVVEVGKGHRPHSFRRCSGEGADEVIQKAKQMANLIQQSSDLWELEHYLTERRKEIDRKYDYRYSRLTHVLGGLLHEGRLPAEELRGLREEKLRAIRSLAELFANTRPDLDSERNRLIATVENSGQWGSMELH